MKKNELMNGDIVVLRSGHIAVVIKNDTEYLLYQNRGWEDLEDYDEDMVYLYPDKYTGEDAIMQVYRTDYGFGFNDFEDFDPVYERDYTWMRPTEAEMKERAETIEQMRKAEETIVKESAARNKKDLLGVVMQAFYGNRTYTELTKDSIDRMLLGYLDNSLTINDEIDRSIIKLPNSECVIVYNTFQEAQSRENIKKWFEEDGFTAKPLAVIPEFGIELFSRCFMCRMNADDIFECIKDEDYTLIEKYFAE